MYQHTTAVSGIPGQVKVLVFAPGDSLTEAMSKASETTDYDNQPVIPVKEAGRAKIMLCTPLTLPDQLIACGVHDDTK